MQRGILYIVWGQSSDKVLERSIQSVRRQYPDIPIEISRTDGQGGLLQKSRMGGLTPFESTLYLDADTVVLGNLDFAFERSEQFGLACSICECPWLRRYGQDQQDRTEYNTGVIFFSKSGRKVLAAWEELAPVTPAKSSWLHRDGKPCGLAADDQASFAQAILTTNFYPYILPLNWNFRPAYHTRFFVPVKIWHSYRDVPKRLIPLNDACQRGTRPVSLVDLTVDGESAQTSPESQTDR